MPQTSLVLVGCTFKQPITKGAAKVMALTLQAWRVEMRFDSAYDTLAGNPFNSGRRSLKYFLISSQGCWTSHPAGFN